MTSTLTYRLCHLSLTVICFTCWSYAAGIVEPSTFAAWLWGTLTVLNAIVIIVEWVTER